MNEHCHTRMSALIGRQNTIMNYSLSAGIRVFFKTITGQAVLRGEKKKREGGQRKGEEDHFALAVPLAMSQQERPNAAGLSPIVTGSDASRRSSSTSPKTRIGKRKGLRSFDFIPSLFTQI